MNLAVAFTTLARAGGLRRRRAVGIAPPCRQPARAAPRPAMAASACPLERACVALWSATLSLMAAYMQQPAAAHRMLLACRIAANFGTLARQESFSPASRDAFARLQGRWQGIAAGLARPTAAESGRGSPDHLLSSTPQHL
jgi:hypothetical protein